MKAFSSSSSRRLGTQTSIFCSFRSSLCEQKASMIEITASFGSKRAPLCTSSDALCDLRRALERVGAPLRTIDRRLDGQRFALCAQRDASCSPSDAPCSEGDALCSTSDALTTQKGAAQPPAAPFGPLARRPTSRASARAASAARILRQSVGMHVSSSDEGTSTPRPMVMFRERGPVRRCPRPLRAASPLAFFLQFHLGHETATELTLRCPSMGIRGNAHLSSTKAQ